MIKKTSFIKLIQLWGIIVLIMIGGSIIILDIVSSRQDFNSRADQMRVDYIAQQKQLIKSEVGRVVDMINHQKAQSEELTKSAIKSRVYEAYAIAQNIYQQNKEAKSDFAIQQMIVDVLRPIRFKGGKGYYFISSIDGTMKLNPFRTELEGIKQLNTQDSKGQYIARDLIKIVQQSGEGFYEYHWTKPGAKGNDFKKISFVKRFEPFNWFIGTGLYVDDVEASIKEKLMGQINKIRFGVNGYFFVDSFQGISLAHGIQPGLIGTNMWETEDSKGNKTTQMLIAAARKEEGGYVSYWWRKSSTAKESPKIAYAKGVPDWKILVGTGVYLDDVETDIAAIYTKLNNQIKTKILSFALIVIGIIIFVLFFFNRLNRRLKNDFNLFISFFNRAAHSNESINRDLIQFVELDQMAENANKMLQDKILAQQSLLGEREALQESEEKYREIFNTPNDAILMHDADSGAILDVNLTMLEMFGYSYEEALQQNLGTLSLGKSPYTLEEAIQNVENAKSQGPQLFEWRSKRKNGELFWSEVGLKFREFAGKRHVVAIVRDISDRKDAERVLASERERLAVTLRSIGDGVITTDIDGNITLINKVAENLTGWSQAEALGKFLPEVFNIINEKTGERSENPVEKVMATGKIIGLANHTVLIARDGTTRSIADSGAPIMDRESRIIGVVLVFRDVTEANRLEEELLKVRKLESVGVLAGGIAHDFNNILAAILGNISLAMTITNPKDEIYELLLESEKASLRAKDLTQQLLTFAKGGEPVKKIAAIDEVIKDSSGFVLRGSNVRCDFKFGTELRPVAIDAGQISQVIQNIIINASQAMPTGGTITIDCSNYCLESSDIIPLSSGNYIKIVVKDQGVGIPVDMLDKIFDPYFTTKQKGSGLGLAITHSIISKHDGYITVDSKPGQGTTFTIYLPASQGRSELEQKDVLVPPVTAQGRIMIMDDEEMIRSLVETALSRIGYEVVLAEDGDEAVLLYQKAKEAGAPIDLIIMDLTIPGGMGGKDAIKKIHKIDPEAKVIVSSGYSNDPVMANFSEYGFCAAMVKPFQMRELMEFVDKAISS
jgi:PAS domain S-box-containing protein